MKSSCLNAFTKTWISRKWDKHKLFHSTPSLSILTSSKITDHQRLRMIKTYSWSSHSSYKVSEHLGTRSDNPMLWPYLLLYGIMTADFVVFLYRRKLSIQAFPEMIHESVTYAFCSNVILWRHKQITDTIIKQKKSRTRVERDLSFSFCGDKPY